MSRKVINVPIGVRFGKWVVIEDIGIIGVHSCVRCRCDCGKICNVPKYCLIAGTSTSCGHSQDGVGYWEIKDDYATITFTLSGVTVILDRDDFDIYKDSKTYINRYHRDDKYLQIKHNGKWELFHRVVMNAQYGQVVDHINGNTMDNRKINLRFATSQQNAFNHKVSTNNISGVSGVGLDKRNNRWRAHITCSFHRYFLGGFDTKDEAITARKQAEEQYFGEFKHE